MDAGLFGAHAPFVWGGYALGVAVVAWNLAAARLSIASAMRAVRERIDEDECPEQESGQENQA